MSLKTAVIPQVRVDPELRDQLESMLNEGESISEFIEASVRSSLEARRVERDFHARGEAAWNQFVKTGKSMPASDVLDRLQGRLDARRKQLAAKAR